MGNPKNHFNSIIYQILSRIDIPNPSANPNTILPITKATRLCARRGVINVAMLHNRTLLINTFFAPNREAQQLAVDQG